MSFGMHIVPEQPQANHMQMYAARTPDGQWPAGDTYVRENTARERERESESDREKGATVDVRAFKYFRPGCVAKWSIIRSSTWASVSITHTHIQKRPPLVGLVGACTATFPIAM
jgi:hypothetical protein